MKPHTKKIVAIKQQIRPIDIIKRMPENTNAFLVITEQTNDDKYKIAIADR